MITKRLRFFSLYNNWNISESEKVKRGIRYKQIINVKLYKSYKNCDKNHESFLILQTIAIRIMINLDHNE